MIDNLDQALHYLKGREKFGIKFGLENISKLAEALGHPEQRYRSALVAGTNGKGSTVALLDSILRASGMRVGRYTSPHIRHLSERIVVDGRPVSDTELVRAVARVETVGEEVGEPTFFEALTATAFDCFAASSVELAIFEVGMGGRWDATNVAPADVSVITPIGFDHERFLGDTITAIAGEKAAIIKPGRPVVVGRLVPEALSVVVAEARRVEAPLVLALDDVEIHHDQPAPEEPGHVVRLRTPAADYGELHLPLEGEHQVDNLVVAVRAAELLRDDLAPASVREGVRATRWPGRLERVPGRPSLLFDAAHNIMAARRLATYLERRRGRRRVLLFGVMKDKRVYEMLEALLPHVDHVVATMPEMSRARGPAPLAAWAEEHGTPAEAVASTSRALDRAKELAGLDGEVVVAGSIFLLGEVYEAMGRVIDGAPRTTARTPA